MLKKVDLITYPSDAGHRDAKIIRRYMIQKPDDYSKYNRICGKVRRLAHLLSLLDASDPTRRKFEDLLLEKLWDIGVLGIGLYSPVASWGRLGLRERMSASVYADVGV